MSDTGGIVDQILSSMPDGHLTDVRTLIASRYAWSIGVTPRGVTVRLTWNT